MIDPRERLMTGIIFGAIQSPDIIIPFAVWRLITCAEESSRVYSHTKLKKIDTSLDKP